MRHVHYSDRPAVGNHINWSGLLWTVLVIGALVWLVWWLGGVISGDAALFDWLPGR